MINLNFIYSELFLALSIMTLLIVGVFKKNSSILVYNLGIISLLICSRPEIFNSLFKCDKSNSAL